jgi:putative tricarboxylic transport membrane protein
MNADLLQGLYLALSPTSILATALGALHGLISGMMPGLTTSAGIIILFPITFILEPTTAVALLLGVFVGGMTGGSFAAILINIPGSPSASATTLDGFPLTQKGEAGRALGISIISGFTGGLFSFCCLLLIAPQLTKIALQFQAADLFGLVFFGLTVISAFAAKTLVKGLLSTFLGLTIITVGMDPLVGTERFTFGSADMLAGIHFIPALVGLFAIPEIAANLAEGNIRGTAPRFGRFIPSWQDIKNIRLPLSIGSIVGTFIGILPGAGGPIAVFVSYDYAQKTSKNPEKFGKGCIEGVAAPESANSAIAGGALVPMMTLGIPGDPITAILIGALLVHGMAPGPLLFVEQGPFAYSVLFSYFIAICSMAVVAFLGLRVIVKLLTIPRSLLLPIIIALCVLGTYALRNSFFDIYVMFFFGLLAMAFKWLKIPVVPLLLALVLGPQIEEHLRVALTSSKGDISIFYTSPWCLFFLCLSVVSLVWPFLLEWRTKSRAKA